MMVLSSRRRRFGASIIVFAALVSQTPIAHAVRRAAAHAQTVSTPKKTSASKKTSAPSRHTTSKASKTPTKVRPAKTVSKKAPRLTAEEVERAGILASERTDRDQAERLDPSNRNAPIEDRVHAWMRTHHSDASPDTAEASKPVRSRSAASAKATHPASKAESASTADDRKAIKTTSGRKATAADFDAAAAAQSHAPQPQPSGKPRSAVDMPGDEPDADGAETADSADAQPEKPVSKREAARIAKSPTPHMETPRPEAERKPVSATAALAANAREKRKALDPETAEKLTPKAFTAKADETNDLESIAQDELDDDDVPTTVPVSPLLRHDKRGHVIMPAALKGSREILVHQNVMADHDGLDRIQDNDDLARMSRARLLVALPASSALLVNQGLPANRRYTRPWTARFLTDMSRAHYARFHAPIQVNSAVRTVDFQRQLIRVNGNAAPPTGETASPHLTGQAIDLAKRGMSLTEIAWMRGYLLPLVQQGKIDVEEEFQQACFHISVYKAYMPQAVPRRSIKPKHSTSRMIAAGIQ